MEFNSTLFKRWFNPVLAIPFLIIPQSGLAWLMNKNGFKSAFCISTVHQALELQVSRIQLPTRQK